ncbi:MAG TPA: 2-amino-4-hydroxy-6-hydroxymethyldihydropteridine diphosphokinase [Thiolinea sp.]|nr:2-amino-4-hydroxy-6-hydroxymethyldihydropteridine diphosphokinase [Thiolinea sp.]
MAQAYVSLGSNVRAEANICSATQCLQARFKQLISSDIYQSPAEGFDGEPFLNSVVGFETDLDIAKLRAFLRTLETIHGRERGGDKFAPRTLDLDLLLYDDVVLPPGPDGNLPHTDILKYPFVLYPLAEIAGERQHPVLKHRFSQIARHSQLLRNRLIMVDLDCRKRPQPDA